MARKIGRAFCALILAGALWGAPALAVEKTYIPNIYLDHQRIEFAMPPVVTGTTTMVPARSIADALGLQLEWYGEVGGMVIENETYSLALNLDSPIMTVTHLHDGAGDLFEYVDLPETPLLVDGSAYVPLRPIVEALGGQMVWESNQSMHIYLNAEMLAAPETELPELAPVQPVTEAPTEQATEAATEAATEDATEEETEPVEAVKEATSYLDTTGHTFYFQNQEEWQLDDYGRGYCWAVSYAMLLTDVTATQVTPVDVDAVNKKKSSDGAYCYHYDIVSAFGARFIKALDESSPYYGGYSGNNGGTAIANPDGDDEVARAALREALDRNPAGVMVRYAGYPHTVVAIGYDDEKIYFNDPMYVSSGYAKTSSKSGIPFEETCMGMRGMSLSEITFIQALAAN